MLEFGPASLRQAAQLPRQAQGPAAGSASPGTIWGLLCVATK